MHLADHFRFDGARLDALAIVHPDVGVFAEANLKELAPVVVLDSFLNLAEQRMGRRPLAEIGVELFDVLDRRLLAPLE